MPRGRGQQNGQESHQKGPRVARLRNTPPSSKENGIDKQHSSQATNLANLTLNETRQTEMKSSIFGTFPKVGPDQNSTNSTMLQNGIQSQSDNVSKIMPEDGANFSENSHFPSILPTVSKDKIINAAHGLNMQRSLAGLYPSLLSSLGYKKLDSTLPIMDSSVFSPSWIQTCEKVGLSKDIATSQGLTEYSPKDSVDEIKTLKDEMTREKASRLLIEQQLYHEIHQRELIEQELEYVNIAKQELEERLHVSEERLHVSEQRKNELRATLSTAQQALEEYHNSSSSSDWVLYRDEILLSDKIIGVGGWGRVMEGTFRGCKVAVKQIHDLILSAHNRRLFEREMSIASRCRHPCLLQFIGATNDDQSPLFVTELLDTSLRAVLQKRALKLTEISTITLDVAKGLNYLHLNHPSPIIHRDISSANVLLWKHGQSWRAKVSDYGTANFMQYSMTVGPGAVVYSAPEAQTSRQSPKVDTYSFGVLLCEMNIREFPDVAHRDEQVAMVTNHFYRDLIRRCLIQDPVERPAMETIINLLENQRQY